MSRGLVLFAHGARDPRWAEPFEAVAARARAADPALDVVLAYLELMAPSLLEAGRQLAARGCTDVDIVPLFLGAGGHIRRDLPQLLAQLEAELPTQHWRLHPPVGELPSVINAIAAAALGAAASGRRDLAEPTAPPEADE
ncbi:sirohydrochlorin chelatase [Piscinibacter koreensis]|uniref:CbiX/SirB N-terminal domain-containing protein n=1 Tax=Piscinibacter koreensis TaxID=2742824 RepID=A0A7Y6NS41_9BURK|nr:CbiX/SirB N-terminal domain-containing protein [Schlegelella koreensis]NUZ08278.1 CbiX/SirB N-terminal domain-containing protein [Schlegelella koreensis]